MIDSSTGKTYIGQFWMSVRIFGKDGADGLDNEGLLLPLHRDYDIFHGHYYGRKRILKPVRNLNKAIFFCGDFRVGPLNHLNTYICFTEGLSNYLYGRRF
jgi:hypothetical protein